MWVTATQKGFINGRLQRVGDQFECPPELFSDKWMVRGKRDIQNEPEAPIGALPIAESQVLGKEPEADPPALGPTRAPKTAKKKRGRPPKNA